MDKYPNSEKEALSLGWTEYPFTQKKELRILDNHNFAAVDCTNIANTGAVCGKYVDQSGRQVISVCSGGMCGQKFLVSP